MQIAKAMSGSPKPVEGTPKRFAGRVLAQELVQGTEEGAMKALCVSFAPWARTHWHRHPEGQIL